MLSLLITSVLSKDRITSYKPGPNFEPTKPEGISKKLLDSKLRNSLGFKPEISLKDGLIKTYQDYIKT